MNSNQITILRNHLNSIVLTSQHINTRSWKSINESTNGNRFARVGNQYTISKTKKKKLSSHRKADESFQKGQKPHINCITFLFIAHLVVRDDFIYVLRHVTMNVCAFIRKPRKAKTSRRMPVCQWKILKWDIVNGTLDAK